MSQSGASAGPGPAFMRRSRSGPRPARGRPAAVRAAAVLAAALALCWAALLNGQPFFHTDTQSYVRGPDVAVSKLLGERHATAWVRKAPQANDDRLAGAAEARPSQDDGEVQASRSIYYGLLAYLGHLAGGFWLTVFVQGLAVAALMDVALRAAGARSLQAYGMVTAVVALGTPAPFFVGLLMPDIWAGTALGAAAVLLAFPRRLSRAELAILAALMGFGCLAHNSVVLALILTLAAGWLLGLLLGRRGPDPRPAFALGAAAVALAALGNAAFSAAVEKAVGRPPMMPPFVTAKLIEDGPGTRFVRERCGDQFEVCRYADRLPLKVDDFLWSYDPRTGVYHTVSTERRVRLGEEQTRFALAVARAYPLEQTAASLKNIGRQLINMELEDFAYDPVHRVTYARQLPERHLNRMLGTPAYRGTLPLRALEIWHQAVLAASLLGAGLVWARRASAGLEHRVFLGMIAAALLANAAVCGALSALHGRYQARVVWLLPLGAALLACSAGAARSSPRPQRLRPQVEGPPL